MSVVRWSRARARSVVDPLEVDELGGQVLVLDDVTADDDPRLGWCRHAPCVVIACTDGGRPATSADIALAGDERRHLEPLLANIVARPQASRALVDVLRPMPELDRSAGLVLEAFAYSTLLAGPEFAAWLADQPARVPRRFDAPPVRVERDGPVLRIALARPENRNAFSAAMRDSLFEALTVAAVDGAIEGVVLSGDGPVFSSGGDLSEFGTTPDVVRAREVRTQRSVGGLLAQLAPTVTAHVHGSCVGAGVELAAFAGHVVADPNATFRLPEISMGLIPGAGGTVSITRRIGRQHTARLALLGEPIDAAEALARGLIDEIRGS